MKESNEINNLKEKLKKAEKIIEQQKSEIKKLQNQLNLANNKLNELQSLRNLIAQKDFEINKLRQGLQNININNNNNRNISLNTDKCVNFISNDQRINFAIPCNGNSIFAEIEEKLYQEYPEYRETNNIFLANGKEVLRFKTINYNNIGTGRPIMLVKPS